MVQRLLARKRNDAHSDYETARFEAALGRRFQITRREEFASRALYEARPL